MVAQWMEDGSWRLLKSLEAELVMDAIALKQLQVPTPPPQAPYLVYRDSVRRDGMRV
jgi:hypothetical protein